jgi:hypothetical protein
MNTLTIMFFLWGLAATGFTAVMVYRAILTQHETDQLFLGRDELVDFNHAEHDEIVRRVNRLRPFYQGFGGAAALITVAIVSVYVAQALPYVRF